MIITAEKDAAGAVIRQWRSRGKSIGLVPTMGYFHDGHLALMAKAAELCDHVVVSLFVNPTQFGPCEDLGSYPRNFEGDCSKAKAAGVDLLFCPVAGEMYDPQHQTSVAVAGLSQGLCGADRPGHFTGVTTVVAKLFNVLQPDWAVFGEKDFQQLAVVRRMVADLDFPVKIIGHPIVRELDGLAMSSRNAYLQSSERAGAVVLYQALEQIRQEIMQAGLPCSSAPVLATARHLIEAQPGCSIDYLTIIDNDSLEECASVTGPCRAVGAIRINNRIRLIDNCAVGV